MTLLSMPGALEELAGSAGLRAGTAGEVPTPYTYPDVATAVRAQLSSGPAVLAAAHAGAEALKQALTPVMRRFRNDTGEVRLENVFRYLIAWT